MERGMIRRGWRMVLRRSFHMVDMEDVGGRYEGGCEIWSMWEG